MIPSLMDITFKILLLVLQCGLITNCTSNKENKNINKIEPIMYSVKTTAYTDSETSHRKYGSKTSTGKQLKRGIIASDWSVFPVGTVLKINDRLYTVEDFGSALVKPKGVKPVIDIFVPSKYEMNRWGAKHFDNVEIVKLGSFEKSLQFLKPRLKYKHCRIMYNNIQNKLKE